MPVTVSEIDDAIQHGIDQIAEKAIAAYGLTFDRTSQTDLCEPLLRWTDFTLRYIAPVPRHILVSKRFPAQLPPEAQTGIERIRQLLIEGKDINGYQSKTLTRFNDTSGSKSQKRTDGLWADWGIHHLHLPLNAVSHGQEYSERSDWLLFLMVYHDAALFIDVKKHDEENLFSLRELVETYIDSWPEDAERFRLKGILGVAGSSPSDAERKELRNSGVTTMLEVNGKVYMGPGMGVTSAVTSTRVSLLRNRIRTNARAIAKEIAHANGPYLTKMKELGIDSPEFGLMLLDSGDLAVYEKRSDIAWRIPRTNPQYPDDGYCAFHNALLPDWASAKVLQYSVNP